MNLPKGLSTFFAFGFIFGSVFGSTTSSAGSPEPLIEGRGFCTSSESWDIAGVGSEIPPEDLKEFNRLLNHRTLPVRGFSEGYSLRKRARTDLSKAFGEYWIARALTEAKLLHIAFDAFSYIAARPIRPSTLPVQLAALGCLYQLHSKQPSMAIPAQVAARLPEFAALQGFASMPARKKEVIWESAGWAIRALLASDVASPKGAEKFLPLLEGSGPHIQIARGLIASKRGETQVAIRELSAFISAAESSVTSRLPASLAGELDSAHLLLAHAYYRAQKFDAAADQLKRVSKKSNELAESLSALSWSYLMNDRQGEAIGTAINLQAGGLRKTFAPEAPMVLAMALNELCQYPESVRAIQTFRKNYESSHRWLSSHSNHPDKRGFYALAIDFVRKKNAVPERIGGEWVRSPVFISTQDEINLIFEERDSTRTLAQSGASEQVRLGEKLLTFARDLKNRILEEKKKNKPDQGPSQKIKEDLAELRLELLHYRRLKSSAPAWKILLSNYTRKVPAMEAHLVNRINQDLSHRTGQMLAQLEEVAENIQLIEVEIYNGASQDIIWQNAHPDYAKVAKQMKNEHQRASQEQVWDWGQSRVLASDDDGGGEIWEDELGSFKANLYDNCSSKDKFLALRRLNRG